MAYSAVPTITTGDNWTAANHNTYIQDNFAAGVPDIFTAAGELVYATAANTSALLSAGTALDGLIAGSAAPAWQGMVGALVTRSAVQSISNTTETALSFDTEIYDTLLCHGVAFPDRLYATLPGYWHVYAIVIWASNSTGDNRRVRIVKNGTTEVARFNRGSGFLGAITCRVGITVSCSISDFFQCLVYQDSGGALDVDRAASYYPLFGIYKRR